MGKVIAIGGPTASGKSEVAVALAKRIDAVIISCDVMQSYMEMNIGTAKVTKDEMGGVEHYLTDVFKPNENIDAAIFSKLALETIYKKVDEGKNVILAGGSGLYLDSIYYSNYSYEENTADPAYRKNLESLLIKNGKEFLYEMLIDCDEAYAKLTHPNNVKRVMRALEYYHLSKEKLSEKKRSQRQKRFSDSSYFLLNPPRDQLYDRINKRVDRMIASGLIDEVHTLMNKYPNYENLTSFKAIGYKEICEYLNGNISYNEAVSQVKTNSRRYAKRQLTWFNANEQIIKIPVDYNENSVIAAEKIYEALTHNEY